MTTLQKCMIDYLYNPKLSDKEIIGFICIGNSLNIDIYNIYTGCQYYMLPYLIVILNVSFVFTF